MKLIVGLGNPGLKYRFTRHNVGFLAVRYIAEKNNIAVRKKRFNSLLGEGIIGKEKVILALPFTFMNLSGDAVNSILRYRETNLKDLLIICDDINLVLNRMRLRAKGSAGGHKGLKSIITSLGSQNFPRLRIGIGKNPDILKSRSLTDYVLEHFSKDELKIIHSVIPRAAEVCDSWVKEGVEVAMNKFNVRDKDEKL